MKDAHILKLAKFIWLFPLLYFLHDLEEILTIESFLKEQANVLPVRITAIEFSLAFMGLWVLGTIGCCRTARGRTFLSMSPVMFLAFLVPGVLLANGTAHVLQLIILRSYVPGIVTSVLILFPYAFASLKYLLMEKLITAKKCFFLFGLGFILQLPLAGLALLLAKWILR
ncbi:HXXEE domain-containing protein [Bacillus xiapuensis]|uniref:HXXEE domain-containing protein n=1 Tax=Bacillus xiapuensis TaxID=2014075 RepID=UPI0012FD81BB|nr:HXXEE domain-containing protein [Bacillus xiapuensis]